MPPLPQLPAAQLLEMDRYAIAQAQALAAAVAADYARFEFHLVVQRLQTYCSEDLGGFYLDVLKDRLYTTAPEQRRPPVRANRARADPRHPAAS